jgi:2-hydroxychromene-2-carboxylate isomerase
LTEATNAAQGPGIFGAPTFAISAEIFWGDDPPEEAVNYAVRS